MVEAAASRAVLESTPCIRVPAASYSGLGAYLPPRAPPADLPRREHGGVCAGVQLRRRLPARCAVATAPPAACCGVGRPVGAHHTPCNMNHVPRAMRHAPRTRKGRRAARNQEHTAATPSPLHCGRVDQCLVPRAILPQRDSEAVRVRGGRVRSGRHRRVLTSPLRCRRRCGRAHSQS